jgi:hypothetical protein
MKKNISIFFILSEGFVLFVNFIRDAVKYFISIFFHLISFAFIYFAFILNFISRFLYLSFQDTEQIDSDVDEMFDYQFNGITFIFLELLAPFFKQVTKFIYFTLFFFAISAAFFTNFSNEVLLFFVVSFTIFMGYGSASSYFESLLGSDLDSIRDSIVKRSQMILDIAQYEREILVFHKESLYYLEAMLDDIEFFYFYEKNLFRLVHHYASVKGSKYSLYDHYIVDNLDDDIEDYSEFESVFDEGGVDEFESTDDVGDDSISPVFLSVLPIFPDIEFFPQLIVLGLLVLGYYVFPSPEQLGVRLPGQYPGTDYDKERKKHGKKKLDEDEEPQFIFFSIGGIKEWLDDIIRKIILWWLGLLDELKEEARQQLEQPNPKKPNPKKKPKKKDGTTESGDVETPEPQDPFNSSEQHDESDNSENPKTPKGALESFKENVKEAANDVAKEFNELSDVEKKYVYLQVAFFGTFVVLYCVGLMMGSIGNFPPPTSF